VFSASHRIQSYIVDENLTIISQKFTKFNRLYAVHGAAINQNFLI